MPVLESSPPFNAEAASAQRWHTRLLALLSAQRAGSLTLHCLLAWPVALLPSLALLGLAYGLLELLGIDSTTFEPPDRQVTPGQVFSAVVFAPLVETLLLGAGLWLLTRLSRRPLFVAGASSVLWGCLHGASGLIWFAGTFWSFYIFSCSYLAWRPSSWWRAYVAAAAPHALINLTAMGMLALRP